jgi:hypothetical protein
MGPPRLDLGQSLRATCRPSATFIRVKKIGPYEYLYLVENAREGGRHVQRVIKALGRRDASRPREGQRRPGQMADGSVLPVTPGNAG